MTFVACHFGYLLRHLLNRLINLRLVTGGASLPGASRDPPLTNAITGIGGCCARVASGPAAAEVHPSEVRADAGRTETAEELGASGKDRSGQNAQSNRRDSAQAGATAAETFRCHAFKSNRQKECVQMPGKWPDQTLDQAFGLPEVLVAVSTSRLSCKRAGKTRTLMPVGIHLETLIKAFSSKNAEILRHAAMFKNVRRTRPYATTSRMLFNFIPSG